MVKRCLNSKNVPQKSDVVLQHFLSLFFVIVCSRGNPLFLDKERYKRLQNLWLQHKIPTMIVQAMENNRNLLGFEWNLM